VPPSAGPARAAEALLRECAERGLTIACAESCTGGLVAAALTDIPGSSAVLWGCVVAYSNDCKARLLGVSADELASHGAVSREVARSMAAGVLEASGADLALSITGIAGPGGGSEDKPVGLVWFAWKAADGRSEEACERFAGNRAEVRSAAAERAMRGALSLAGETRGRRG
jgi:nicotinamide-nucleotide amidase